MQTAVEKSSTAPDDADIPRGAASAAWSEESLVGQMPRSARRLELLLPAKPVLFQRNMSDSELA